MSGNRAIVSSGFLGVDLTRNSVGTQSAAGVWSPITSFAFNPFTVRDPFGTPLTALPDTLPGNAEAGFGTVAGKLTDTLSAFGLIDMGARLYSTVLGRFLQVDPVPGGGVNAYVYPPDPVNMNDYSGMVGTADSYSTWKSRGATPVKDGNLRARRAQASQTWADSQQIQIAGDISGILAGAAGIAVLAIGLSSNPIGWVVGALMIGGVALSTFSSVVSCTASPNSFECKSGILSTGLGVFGGVSMAGRAVTLISRATDQLLTGLGGIGSVSDVLIGGAYLMGDITNRRRR